MRYTVFLFLIWAAPVIGQVQFQWIKDFPAKNSRLLSSDELGNYYLSDGKEILKYNHKDSLFMRFSALNLGEIKCFDVSNPLKILVFYKENSRILFLDNTLSQYSESVDLQELELDQATLACTSYDNGMWIYDRLNFQLIRLNKKFEIAYRTKNLNLILHKSFEPNFMVEKENLLYINDPQTGIAVFDAFGGYIKTIPIKNLNSFQVIQNTINYILDGIFYQYNMKKLTEQQVELPVSGVIGLRIEGNKMMILTNNFLKIYKLT